MTSSAEPSLDQVSELAQGLLPRDQVRLVAQLVAILADARPGPSTVSSDAWDAWQSLRADICAHSPQVRLVKRLCADREDS